jgi:hypothetical protein
MIISGRKAPPDLMAALRRIGLPYHIKSFILRCDTDQLMTIECTFYAHTPRPVEPKNEMG